MLQDAMLKLDAGNAAGARTVLEEHLKNAPADIRALELLAQSYAAQGQTATAVRRIREHAAAYPKLAGVQHALGVWLQRTGAKAEARVAFQAAKAADAALWSSDVALAAIDLADNDLAAAKTRLQPLIDHPRAGIQARALLATTEDRMHNPDAVIAHYRKILEAQPDNVLALNNLAYTLSEQANSPDEALKYAERAKELAGDNATVDDTLGWILYRKGMHARAVPYLQNSVKRQPNAVRHAHLAMAYAAQGDTRRGFDHLQAAIKLGGSSLPEVQAAQNALARSR
jgi:Tfp pilus assembly protein PilF